MLSTKGFVTSLFDRISGAEPRDAQFVASHDDIEDFRRQVMGEMAWSETKMNLVEKILFHSGLGFSQAAKQLRVKDEDAQSLYISFSRYAAEQEPQNYQLTSNITRYLEQELVTKIEMEKLGIKVQQIAMVGDGAPIGYSRYCADKFGSLASSPSVEQELAS